MKINESGRRAGKRSKLLITMHEKLSTEGVICVLGIHDPNLYVNELKKMHLEVHFTETSYTKRGEIVFDFWGEPIEIKPSKTIKTGYKYTLVNHPGKFKNQKDLLEPEFVNLPSPSQFAQKFARPDLGSEYTRQMQEIYKNVKPLPFLRTPKLNIPWDDLVNNYLNSPDKLNRGSLTFASRTKNTGIAYVIPLSARKKYQKFPKEMKPFNLNELESQGIEVKTWNGEAWVKYGYDHINGLS